MFPFQPLPPDVFSGARDATGKPLTVAELYGPSKAEVDAVLAGIEVEAICNPIEKE